MEAQTKQEAVDAKLKLLDELKVKHAKVEQEAKDHVGASYTVQDLIDRGVIVADDDGIFHAFGSRTM